jgi:ferredoxin
MCSSGAMTACGSSRRRRRTSVTTIVFDGADGPGHGPDSGRGVARIPDSLIDLAVDAAEECPGECIMIEPFDQTAISNRGV